MAMERFVCLTARLWGIKKKILIDFKSQSGWYSFNMVFHVIVQMIFLNQLFYRRLTIFLARRKQKIVASCANLNFRKKAMNGSSSSPSLYLLIILWRWMLLEICLFSRSNFARPDDLSSFFRMIDLLNEIKILKMKYPVPWMASVSDCAFGKLRFTKQL